MAAEKDDRFDDLLHLLKAKKIQLKRLLLSMDMDNDGKLTTEEFVGAILSLQLPPPVAEIRRYAENCDQNIRGNIVVTDFLSFLDQFGKELEDTVGERMTHRYGSVHAAFDMWDTNRDLKISLQEFQEGVKNLKMELTEMQIIYLVRLADPKGQCKFITQENFFRIFSKFEDRSKTIKRMKSVFNKQSPPMLFRALNKSASGKLTVDEFSAVETMVPGAFRDSAHVVSFFKGLDSDNDDKISYREFLNAFEDEAAKPLYELVGDVLHDRYGSLVKAFKVFNTNGDGKLTEGSFRWRCRRLLIELTEHDITQLWKTASPARNLIDLRKFCWLFSPPETQRRMGDLIVRLTLLSEMSSPAASWLAISHNPTAVLTEAQLVSQTLQLFPTTESGLGEVLVSEFASAASIKGSVNRASFMATLEDVNVDGLSVALEILVSALGKYRSMGEAVDELGKKKQVDSQELSAFLLGLGRSSLEVAYICKRLESHQLFPLAKEDIESLKFALQHSPPKVQTFDSDTLVSRTPKLDSSSPGGPHSFDSTSRPPIRQRRFSSIERSGTFISETASAGSSPLMPRKPLNAPMARGFRRRNETTLGLMSQSAQSLPHSPLQDPYPSDGGFLNSLPSASTPPKTLTPLSTTPGLRTPPIALTPATDTAVSPQQEDGEKWELPPSLTMPFPPKAVSISIPEPVSSALIQPLPPAKHLPPMIQTATDLDLGKAVSQALMAQFPSLLDAFLALDSNGDGWLSVAEIEKGLQLAQIELPKKQILGLSSRMDINGDNKISFVEFCRELEGNEHTASLPIATPKSWKRAMSLEMGEIEKEAKTLTEIRHALLAKYSTLQRAFSALDINCDGRLTVKELQRGLNLSAEEASSIHSKMDVDRDGYVSQQEFDYALILKSSGRRAPPAPRTVKKKEVTQLKEVVSVVLSDKFKSAAEAFRAFDTNDDGKVSMIELRSGLQLAGIGLSESQVINLLQLADKDRNNVIDAKEFITAFQRPEEAAASRVTMSVSVLKSRRETIGGQFRRLHGSLFTAFRALDKTSKGHLTFRNLRDGIKSLGLMYSDPEIEFLAHESDIDKDGVINYVDFTKTFEDSETSAATSYSPGPASAGPASRRNSLMWQ